MARRKREGDNRTAFDQTPERLSLKLHASDY